MFKKIVLGTLLVLVLAVGGLAVVIAMKPSEYRIERSARMAAPPAAVFAQVNDFHKWQGWSPWAKVDPNAKNSFEGAAEGKGAVFNWAGNSEIGEGRMTITESKPHEHIQIELHFIKPFEGTDTVYFTFKPEGDQTVVTWAMDGRHNFVSKAICLFMDMDKMVGDKYDEGLANMKAIVEKK